MRVEAVAWQTAAYMRSRKLPQWNRIARKYHPPKRQTTEQMMAIAKALTLAFGGTVIEQEGPDHDGGSDRGAKG